MRFVRCKDGLYARFRNVGVCGCVVVSVLDKRSWVQIPSRAEIWSRFLHSLTNYNEYTKINEHCEGHFNVQINTIQLHCWWEDDMARETTGHLLPHAEVKKIMLTNTNALYSWLLLRLAQGMILLLLVRRQRWMFT